ncbi:hypothetical protein C8J56DRAFT_905857 [Mycena floridula]|nr:hypothetical protein C8J56DRAFT_905857 [Mycena floridula]
MNDGAADIDSRIAAAGSDPLVLWAVGIGFEVNHGEAFTEAGLSDCRKQGSGATGPRLDMRNGVSTMGLCMENRLCLPKSGLQGECWRIRYGGWTGKNGEPRKEGRPTWPVHFRNDLSLKKYADRERQRFPRRQRDEVKDTPCQGLKPTDDYNGWLPDIGAAVTEAARSRCRHDCDSNPKFAARGIRVEILRDNLQTLRIGAVNVINLYLQSIGSLCSSHGSHLVAFGAKQAPRSHRHYFLGAKSHGFAHQNMPRGGSRGYCTNRLIRRTVHQQQEKLSKKELNQQGKAGKHQRRPFDNNCLAL